MRYFNRSPPCLTIPDRSSLILFAAPILSGMAIRQLSALALSFQHTHCGYQHYHARVLATRASLAESR